MDSRLRGNDDVKPPFFRSLLAVLAKLGRLVVLGALLGALMPVRAPWASIPIGPAEHAAVAPIQGLKDLKTHLALSRAAGPLTKSAINAELSGLVDAFRRYHAREPGVGLDGLRRNFDLMIMKLGAILQDEDEALFEAVLAGRDRIWRDLADPQAFARL